MMVWNAMNKVVGALVLLGLLAGSAQSAEFYLGASLGLAAGGPSLGDRSASGLNEPRGSRILTGYDTSYSGSDNLPSGQLTAGWQFRDNLAVELSAFRTATADTVETRHLMFSNGTTASSETSMEQQLDGFSLSLLGQKSLSGTLSGLWRLGVASTRQELSYTVSTIKFVPYDGGGIVQFIPSSAGVMDVSRKTGLVAGAGLSRSLGAVWQGRVELTGTQLEEGVLLTLGAGVTRRF